MAKRFSTETVRQILARATQLEVVGKEAGISENESMEIAAEAGIDRTALLRAIAEIESEGHVASRRRGSTPIGDIPLVEWAKTIVTPVVAGGFGLCVGLLTGFVRTGWRGAGVHVETMIGDVMVIAAAWTLSRTAKGELRHLTFQTSNLLLWLGFAVGFSSTYPLLADDASSVALLSAVGSGLVGSALIWLRDRRRGRNTPEVVASAEPEVSPQEPAQERLYDQASVERAILMMIGRQGVIPQVVSP
jgi:hypothetical protein